MLSSNLLATVGSPDSLGQNSRRRQKFWHKLPEVSTPTRTTKAVPNFTLQINNLTTPLSSGLMKMLGHSLDAEMPPNHRSSPNPKIKLGRGRDKQTQVILSKSQKQQAHGTQEFIPRFGNPTMELLRPCC